MDEQNLDYDVAIIGAGWSGLLACKYCLSEGLRTVVLESRDRIGGVWAYTDDQRYAGVMTSTMTTSSRCITEISDFPMPSDYPDFPLHGQINRYLEAYCAHHSLTEHIALNRPVERIGKAADKWRIKTADGAEWTAANIIVAAGVHREPNDISDDRRFRDYSGTLAHSAAIKQIPRQFAGETIVIWGGGESASDIAFEASGIAAHIYFCIPNGQWFVPRAADRWPPFPSARRKIGDHISSRLRLWLSPTHQYSPFIYQYLEYAFGFNGHGHEAWRTTAPYLRSFVNKSTGVLAQVRDGKITPKRDIARCDGRTVHFTDGTTEEVDRIVICSGYRASFPFLDDAVSAGTDQRQWFKYIFYNADPSLAFVGFVRPVVGSIPGIAELQSRYIAKVFAGKCRLPAPTARAATIAADAEFWNHHFRFTSRRLAGLVDHFVYCNQLAKLIVCYPDFLALLRSSPRLWWRAIIAPWNGCQFWLNDLEHRDRIFETYRRYDDNRISQNYIFLALAPLLPLIGLYTQLRLFLRERFAGSATVFGQPALTDSEAGQGDAALLLDDVHDRRPAPAAVLPPTEVVGRIVEMLNGVRSRDQAADYIHPRVSIHMDGSTHRGIEMWQRWVYLLRNCGRLRELQFLPSEMFVDAQDPDIVNLVGRWAGIGRYSGAPHQSLQPVHFRYRWDRGRMVELWTRKSNYDFVLGRWLRFYAAYRLFLFWAFLYFTWTSRHGRDYRLDRAA